MSIREVIDLSSDEETEVTNVSDVKPILSSYASQGITSNRITNSQPISGEYFVKQELGGTENPYIQNKIPYDSCMSSQALVYSNGHYPVSVSPGSSLPVCRQFWKSGDYELGHAHGRVSRNGQNRLRIHPKFLHSNATSHKWAFGAIAELLDNAVDEVQNGATFVILDKFTNPKNADAALLIQDDGGGMGPESLRRCMSFGFSDKQSDSSIGQYGNGFKTSTMRLGADVIVFSRCMNKSVLTQSVGLLSYTFLRQTNADDIAVPMVDYVFDSLTGTFRRIIRQDAKQFSSNLSTLLKWSPFATEFELLKKFDDIGHHGTKAFVYNLWFNDDGVMELDFESDTKDIIINGAHKKVGKSNIEYKIAQKNVATRLQYSLRAYLSVLYLRIPENFKIILRGDIVEPHYIVNDLIYPECIKYNPKVGGIVEAEVITTIGFLNGAPNVRIHGFNVYHRNRLILPFWRVAHNSYGKGRGVVGVLEANFIKPTHDKQDFEKSSVYQKLESRLKDMTYEYWDFHCHLVGYTKSKHPSALNLPVQQLRTLKGKGHVNMNHGATSVIGVPQIPAPIQLGAALNSQTSSSPGQSNFSVNSQTGLSRKRIQESAQSAEMAPLKKQSVAVGISSELGSRHKKLLASSAGQNQPQDVLTMIQENKKLREHCSEHEDTEKKLLLKAEKLGSELLEARLVYKNLLEEIRLLDDVKVEKS